MGTDRTDRVYASPFYATPRPVLPRPPKYTEEELKTLEWGYRRQPVIDQCLRAISDKSIPAEVRRYRALTQDQQRLEQRIRELEKGIAVLYGRRSLCTARLHRADTLARLEKERRQLGDPEILWDRPDQQEFHRGRGY